MTPDLRPLLACLTRVTGLGLLTIALLGFPGSPTERDVTNALGLILALWCVVEVIRSYKISST